MAAVEGCKNRMVVLRENITSGPGQCQLHGLINECEIEKKIRSDLHCFDLQMKITSMKESSPIYIRCRASKIIPILEMYGYEFQKAKSRDVGNGSVEVFWEFMKKV